jgi:hypothetical protein
MARIRTIKPEFWQDEQLAECSPHARLLAIAILQLCDANGVFRYIPLQIHAHAFPWEQEVNTPSLLGELEAAGYLFFYTAEGRRYGCVPGFPRHQRLQGKEAQSCGIYPKPNQQDTGEEALGNQRGSDGEYPGDSPGDTGTGNREQVTGEGECASPTAPSRSEQKPTSSGARGSRIPDDFDLTDQRQDAAWQQGLSEAETRTEFEKFVDYWRGQAGAKGRKADWEATWRNWCRRAVEYRRRTPGQQQKQTEGATLDDASPV